MENFINTVAKNPAEWAMVVTTLITSGVGLLIAHRVHQSSKIAEKLQSSQSIYEQWAKKKELSITVPAITELDSAVYSPDRDYSREFQQKKIWIILIVDIMFNCYLAKKNGNYPEEVFAEDLDAHLGALARFDPDLLHEAVIERGYFGKGSLGEYYAIVSKIIEKAKSEGFTSRKEHNMAANYALLDVFADSAFQGNPLAVFKDARGIAPKDLQSIASELNLSETVFLYPTAHNDLFDARIFTPRNEIPFAGHPSLGSAFCLLEDYPKLDNIKLRMEAGTVSVSRSGDMLLMVPPKLPERLDHNFSSANFAQMIGLENQEVTSVHAFSAGLSFFMIELSSREAVDRAELSIEVWKNLLGEQEIQDIYPFVIEAGTSEPHIYSRLFAPADNIPEDPATGSAAAALAGILFERGISGDVIVHQGYKMGRPSQLLIRIDNEKLYVGGKVARIGEGRLFVNNGAVDAERNH